MEMIRRRNETVYRDSIYVDGQRIRSPYFKRKADVKSWKAKFLSNRELAKVHGEDFKVPVKMTIQEYFKNWYETKILTQRAESTSRCYEHIFRIHLIPRFGKLFLNELTIGHLDELVKDLLEKGYRPKGVNNIIQSLKALFSDAEKKNIIRSNQFKNYENLKVPKLPPHFWSHMEIRQFLQGSMHEPLYPLFVIALNTGMRRGELAGLCWDRIDFQRNMIEVSRILDRFGLRSTTKTGIARHVPMNEIVKATLLDLSKTSKSKFVFSHESGEALDAHHLYRDFTKAQKKAEMDKIIRFHDLRHCFASHFMMNGGNLYDLQKILGHTQYEMTQIYAHLSPEHLAQATQILSFGKEFRRSEVQEKGQLVAL